MSKAAHFPWNDKPYLLMRRWCGHGMGLIGIQIIWALGYARRKGGRLLTGAVNKRGLGTAARSPR